MSSPASKFTQIHRQSEAGAQASERDAESLPFGESSWGTQACGTWLQVVIEEGVLEGVPATVLGVDERDMLIVAVRLLTRWIAVELAPDAVRMEDPGSPAPTPPTH